MRKYGSVTLALIAVFTIGLFSIAFIFTGSTTASNQDSGFEPVSEQIWSVGVSADPGHEGSLSQSFEAAFGNDDYFRMEQSASTSSGEVKRYVDISSPVSGAYVKEDMTVTVKTEITETFMMENMLTEAKIETDWFSIF